MGALFIVAYLLLTVIAIVTLFKNNYKWSLLCFLFFATKGMAILPDETGPIRASYLAFLYVILFIVKNWRYLFKCIRCGVGKRLKWLLVFFAISVFFSIFYYGLPIVQTVVVGSRYLILSSYLFFGVMNEEDRQWLLDKVFHITSVLSVLFIIQAFTGISMLQAANNEIGLDAQGLYHGGILPPFAQILVYVCLFDKTLINKRLRMAGAVLFLMALICTMFRTLLFSTFLTIFLIMLFNKDFKRNLLIMFTVGCLLFYFQDKLSTRANKDGKTKDDIELVLKGEFHEADYQSQNGLTMLYRLALINERLEYLADAPLAVSVFGLGLTVDNRWAYRQYGFQFGLIDDDGIPSQLRTPDIDWGNFVCNYGLGGTILFLIFYVGIILELKKRRKQIELANILFFSSLIMFILSFSGNVLSEPYSLVPFFFLYSIAVEQPKQTTLRKVELRKSNQDDFYNSYSMLQR